MRYGLGDADGESDGAGESGGIGVIGAIVAGGLIDGIGDICASARDMLLTLANAAPTIAANAKLAIAVLTNAVFFKMTSNG